MIQPHERRSHALGRERLRREMRSGYRRSMRLTALGTLLPGAGLTRTRHRVVGWLLLLLVLGSVIVAAFLALTRGLVRTALALVSSPTTLQYAAVALLAVGAIWAGSIILTAVSSRPTRLDRARTRMLAVFTTVMVAFVAGGSYKAAEYALITKDTLNGVFSAPVKPGSGAEVDTTAENPWKDTPRVNLLLLGSDAGQGRVGTRTDTMMVASIDTKTGRTVLIQLPRSLEKAPLAEDSPLRDRYQSGFFGDPNSTCSQGSHGCLLTNLWREAEFFEAENPGSYAADDSPGRREIRGAIQEITGLELHHTVIVDLKGFEKLIDAMGGIDLNVKGGGYDGTQPLPIGGKGDGQGGVIGAKGYFKIGPQHLNGFHALWYARVRALDDDTHRQSRQRCVIRAIIDQVNPAEMVARYADVAKILQEHLYTDIPAAHLPAFVELVERVQTSKIVSLPLTPDKKIFAGNPDYDRVRMLIEKAIAPPPKPTAKPRPTGSPTTTGATPRATPAPSPTTTAEDGADDC